MKIFDWSKTEPYLCVAHPTTRPQPLCTARLNAHPEPQTSQVCSWCTQPLLQLGGSEEYNGTWRAGRCQTCTRSRRRIFMLFVFVIISLLSQLGASQQLDLDPCGYTSDDFPDSPSMATATHDATTLVSSTRAVTSSTSTDFVLSPASNGTRNSEPVSVTTIVLAIVIPLVAILCVAAAILFRVYRNRRERDEAYTVQAALEKARADEPDMEKGPLESAGLRDFKDAKDVENTQDTSTDIPIQLETKESADGRDHYHGL